jgi:hypothetical protein
MENLFTVVFEDNSTFVGGNLINTKWKEIPDKKIRSIFYKMPKGDVLAMTGYDKYFHMVEVLKDINGDRAGIVNFEFVYLLGRKENRVNGYKMSFQTGNIEKIETSVEDNFVKGLNPKFWK